MAKIPGLDSLKLQRNVADDILKKLENMSKFMGDFGESADKSVKSMRNLWDELAVINNEMAGLKGDAFVRATKQASDLQRQIAKVTSEAKTLKQEVIKLTKEGFDKLGKSVLKLQINFVKLGLNSLIGSIQAIYELQERWAKATGKFNMTIGALSPKMGAFRKEIGVWEGTLRGMGEELGTGIQMAAEFANAFDSMDIKGWSRLGLQLARGFNLGAQASGELAKSFKFMGLDGKGAADVMGELMIGAQIAGIPINALTKDLAESRNFMVEFGQEGAKGFVRAAAYAKQFGVSLKDLERATKVFDKFDDAATTTAKLNSVFGTTINTLDMLMSDDPGERIEIVRKALLGQGKNFDSLTRQERLMLEENLNLSQTQLAALLNQKNAGKSYADMQEEIAKKEHRRVSAQKKMQEQLQKTTQTLFSFGAAMDKIVTAIANAMRPFFEVIGLAKEGGSVFSGFSEVMDAITKRIVKFFKAMEKNDKWKDWMRKLGEGVLYLGKGISKFFSEDKFPKMIESIFNWFNKIKWVSIAIVAAWGGFRLVGAVTAVKKLADNFKILNQAKSFAAGASSGGGGMMGKVAGVAGKMGMGAAVGGGVGYGMSYLTGANKTDSAAGGAIGGSIGSLAGPIGTAIGSTAGAFIAGELVPVFKELTRKTLTKEEYGVLVIENRIKVLKKEQVQMKKMGDARNRTFNAEIALKKKRDSIEKKLIDDLRVKSKGEKEGIVVSKDAADVVRKHAQRIVEFGNVTGTTKDKMLALSNSDGPISITHSMFKTLSDQTKILNDEQRKTLDALNIQLDVKRRQADFDLKELELKAKLAKLSEQDPKEVDKKIKLAKKEYEKREWDLAIAESNKRNYKNRTAEIDFYLISKIQQSKAEFKLAKENLKNTVGVKKERLTVEQDLLKMSKKKLAFELAIQAMAQLSITEGDKITAAKNAGGDAYKNLFQEKGEFSQYKNVMAPLFEKMASGGIVKRPTTARIGENGPEAVIPLKAMARGATRNPSKFGGSAAKSLVNFAGKNKKSGETVIKHTAGNVYLDSRLVGRHIVTSVLESSEI